jgi:hypothetical protein
VNASGPTGDQSAAPTSSPARSQSFAKLHRVETFEDDDFEADFITPLLRERECHPVAI